MGKKTPQGTYRDDPDTVSMHTTRGDYEYDDAQNLKDSLPSYTVSEAAASSSAANIEDGIRANGTAYIEDSYAIVHPSGSNVWRIDSDIKRFNCGEVTIRMDDRLSDPVQLYDYIMEYLRILPPRPTVRIQGWHQETVRRKDKKEKERVCDFDILLSFQSYLGKPRDGKWWEERTVSDSDNTYRGSWQKSKAPGHKQGVRLNDEPIPTLQDWCEDYCASPSKLKVFRINRLIQGMNVTRLKQDIESLVLSTHYRGHLDISFPVEQKAVDIYSPHIINRWRNSWIRYIFYFTFLWIFTWPILLFLTKWWDVYTVDWRWSRVSSEGRLEYATLSEQQWFRKHEALIRDLVVNKYQGDASSHSTHFAAAPGGVSVWNAISTGRIVGVQGWGYDY